MSDIQYDPNGPVLVVSIEFPTLQVVAYTLSLYKAESNEIILRRKGNNRNPQEDTYQLPTPVESNFGRILWFDAVFVDPGGRPNAECEATAIVRQGGTTIGTLSVTGTLTGTSFGGSNFAKLTT